MRKPSVSTITPCFNMKRYLKKFLEELPNQTMFEELEVVLDHNEPDEEEIGWVREFTEKYPGRLKHIIVEKVDPIGTSMNRCIREAGADIVTIWNVDDLRTPDSIEIQYKKLVSSPEIGVVYGNSIMVKSFGGREGVLMDFSKYGAEEFTRSMILGSFVMFKKGLCGQAGFFDEQLKSGADFDLSVRLGFNSKPVFADGLLGYYLNEGKGASTRPNSLQRLERTVIEFRYGIYDKINYDFAPKATQYNITNILYQGEFIPVKKYVPDYDEMIRTRREEWAERGLNRYVSRKILKKITFFEKSKFVKKLASYVNSLIG